MLPRDPVAQPLAFRDWPGATGEARREERDSPLHNITNSSLAADAEHRYPARWLRHNTREALDASRRQAKVWEQEVREAARHAWQGYRARAWGHDQLHPQRGEPDDWFHLGLNIVEVLDTLWLMGMVEEFNEAALWVEERLNFSEAHTKLDSFFEATIRLLGGLLGAHSLSQRPIFLTRARELGDRLISAWPEGAALPNAQVDIGKNFSQHVKWRGNTWSTAEVGTCQLEFRYLSRHTQDPTYATFADRAFNAILDATPNKGLISINLAGNLKPVEQGSTISLGAHGDSYYEYLLKQYLQTSQTEPRLRERWELAIREMMDRLVHTSKDGYLYVAKENDGKLVHEFDHLACFVAGMLAQGAGELKHSPVPDEYLLVAAELTRTCSSMYDTASGLAPEILDFSKGTKSIKKTDMYSLLRPEAVEAMYYMWYYTGDHRYREWAYVVLQGLNRSARTTYGFSSMDAIDSPEQKSRDACESFFFAETLKYLYLVQADPELIPLDQFVFNTEGHPLRIWDPAEEPAPWEQGPAESSS